MRTFKIIALLMVCSVSGFAQNLPEVQPTAKRPPTNLKIDGELSEWGTMGAYNKRVVLYYTIANDDENLYLALKSDNSLITSKILGGGFALSINPAEKNQKDAITVTYPFIDDDETHKAVMKFGVLGINSDVVRSPAQQKAAEAKMEADKVVANRKKIALFKFVKIKGVKEIADKQIPIYNDLGIKVAAKIDSGGDYLYEMAVPLKYLRLQNNTAVINYNIKLLAKYLPTGMVLNPIKTQNGGPPLGEGGVDLRSMTADTDFWGEYVLAK